MMNHIYQSILLPNNFLKESVLELQNLAVNINEYGEVIAMMNDKLNVLIEAEVGEDVGQMLPSQNGANWTLVASIEDFRP